MRSLPDIGAEAMHHRLAKLPHQARGVRVEYLPLSKRTQRFLKCENIVLVDDLLQLPDHPHAHFNEAEISFSAFGKQSFSELCEALDHLLERIGDNTSTNNSGALII